MAREFYDRENELALLKDKYKHLDKSILLVMYGRRRVGKTELIKEFMVDLPQKDKFYFYVDISRKQETLNSLSAAVQGQLGETIIFKEFNDFIDYVHQKSEAGKFLLIMDEFQRFLDTSPEFITQLQNRWDSELRHNKLMIILVGSSIGMMQRITESRAGALYGRATRIKISPFRYVDFRLMFKELNESEKIERFAIFGGTPHYLSKTKKFNTNLSAISDLVLKKGGELAEEPRTLMESENVRVYAQYNSILHSIASGKETLKAISDLTKIPLTAIPAYVQRLDELLDLVTKCDPVLGKERLGRYRIKDHFFRFWYKFIFPNQTALNLGNDKLVLKIIEADLNSYVGRVFEDVIKELLILYLNKKIKGIEINFEDIGSWWDRNGHEIDLVAYNEREKKLLIGEIKWTNRPVDVDILWDLMEKSKLINFGGKYQYLLVSKNGFTDKCLDKMKEIGVLYLDLKEIVNLFDRA
jgi:AAA+ ATPase superfamily predicted ATPase